jgi:hypothetical protein
MEAVARLQAVVGETERIRSGNESQALELMISASNLISPAITGFTSRIATSALDAASRLSELWPELARRVTLPAPGINFIATNVPGAQVPLYLAGRKMIEMVGLVPLGANLGYNVAIVSYNQALVFGMMAEPQLMPDVGLMRSLAAGVFNELMVAAQAKLAAGARAVAEEGKAMNASDAG